MARPHVHITHDGTIAGGRAYLVSEDGTETDISRLVTDVRWELESPMAPRLTLTVRPAAVDLLGAVHEVRVQPIPGPEPDTGGGVAP